MTREEQILNEAIDYSYVEDNYIEYDDCGDVCDDKDFIQQAFESGAKWADENPKEGMVSIDKAAKICTKVTYEFCPNMFRCGEELAEVEELFRRFLNE